MDGSPSFLALIPGQGEGEEENIGMGVWHIFLCQNSNSLNGKSCRRIYRSLWTEENFVMSIILPITLPHISIPRQTACLITINILSHAWIKTWYKNLGGHRKRDARRNVGTGLLRGEATPVRHPPVPCPPSRCCRFPRPERRRRGNRGAEEPRGGGAAGRRSRAGRAGPGAAGDRRARRPGRPCPAHRTHLITESAELL